MRRYETSNGMSNWLRLTEPELSRHYESARLREYALFYCTLMSYERVSGLVGERCGTSRLSDQRLHHLVGEQAAALKTEQLELIAESRQANQEVKAAAVDLYEAESEEVIWLADGICVSEQKARRDGERKEGKERTTTEMAMMRRKDGSYRTLVAGEGVERVDLYRAEIITEYGARAESLPVVAISDGARSIKNEVRKLFGESVCHILDWYHLEAKVCQLMTQIATGKAAKVESTEKLIEWLWRGEAEAAIEHLHSIEVKNRIKQAELIGYLEKNKSSIINYERRKEAGKIIGSGRMEKQNDIVVAHRQKRKGMAWSKSGSLNLAMVTAYFDHRTNHLQ